MKKDIHPSNIPNTPTKTVRKNFRSLIFSFTVLASIKAKSRKNK